ncbi:MAG TPA: ABC transporter ATP-binding protein [Longimicrobium sp.]|uniref:ABC transporter ATP-binding protein n=1 Tax=Longimicrobium sp. TaxID=2029185 RepID=UPI002ED78239
MTAPAAFRFARAMTRMMPRRIALAVGLSLAVTAGEAGGVLLLTQLLALADVGGLAGAAGALPRAVERAFRSVGVQPSLGPVLAMFVAVVIAVAMLQRAQTLVSNVMALEATLEARIRLYRAITRARWLPLARARGSDLLSALTGESDRVGTAASYLLSLLVGALISLVYLALALRVSPVLTAVAVGCGAVLLVTQRRYRAAARRTGKGLSEARAEVLSAATEHLGALKVVKSYGAEERNARIFADAAEHSGTIHLRTWRAYADARAVFMIGTVVLLAIVTWVALRVLHVTGGTVLLLVFLFYRLVPRLASLQTVYQYLSHDLPAWESLDARITALEAEREALSGTEAERMELARSIRFEGVSFAYDAERATAVDGLTMEIQARRTTAIVGPSGAGKTTLADLVMGLVSPREGRIRVDGRTLDESWLRAWRAGIGYVAQDTLLFNDTVLANLLWARPGATEAQVWDALRLAAADGFVAALPLGLATEIGDRGVRLSGGERQRLALARALLRRPALLILDEATSALDGENERRIRDAIRALHGSMTILMITHRLPSVRDADVVHVLEAGRLVESGPWAELVARPAGRFRRLWATQAGEGDAEEADGAVAG